MKRLTLNRAWTLCLKQWKWIIKQLDAGRTESIDKLKAEWMEQNGYGYDEICANCFFCEYANQQGGIYNCECCPGTLVNKKFYCRNKTYNFREKPIKFYKKLLELNKKRKGKM